MLSISLIKKWRKMLSHDSVFHISQPEGSFYSTEEVRGYYNDLTGKAYYTKRFDSQGIPVNLAAHGEKKKDVYFPITIFQFGLGCYDVYLKTGDKDYLSKMLLMADWALSHQKEDGSFDAFGMLEYSCPVSSMAQGEAASLYARAYKETGNLVYKDAMKKACDFMLLSIDQGGTAEYGEEGLILHEYPGKSAVLNGWIFSSFGLYDAWLTTKEKAYGKAFDKAVRGIGHKLKSFDCGHWSYYDLGGKYTSPFYHSLHIELLKTLNKLFVAKRNTEAVPGQKGRQNSENTILMRYAMRWNKNRANTFWSRYAFARKAIQKLTEKKSEEWILAE